MCILLSLTAFSICVVFGPWGVSLGSSSSEYVMIRVVLHVLQVESLAGMETENRVKSIRCWRCCITTNCYTLVPNTCQWATPTPSTRETTPMAGTAQSYSMRLIVLWETVMHRHAPCPETGRPAYIDWSGTLDHLRSYLWRQLQIICRYWISLKPVFIQFMDEIQFRAIVWIAPISTLNGSLFSRHVWCR